MEQETRGTKRERLAFTALVVVSVAFAFYVASDQIYDIGLERGYSEGVNDSALNMNQIIQNCIRPQELNDGTQVLLWVCQVGENGYNGLV